jgi:hypothetical protein
MKSKYIFTSVLALLFFSTLFSQSTLNHLISSEGDANSKVRNTQGSFGGSVYLYKDWNKQVIVKTNSDIYKVQGGNFNVQTGNLEIKISKDSTFVLDPKNTDYIRIDKNYFKYNALNNNQLVQVLYESPKISLYKRFFIIVSKGSYNALTGKSSPNRYKTDSKYTLKQNGIITDKNFKLKKKNILKLFPMYKKEISTFVKENKLSYRDDNDVQKILSFCSNLGK